MAKNRNNMLGVGGQRRKVSRADLRGAPGGERGEARSLADTKRMLAESMRERLDAKRHTAESETAESETAEGTADE